MHLFATGEKVYIFWQNLKELMLQETGFILIIDLIQLYQYNFGYSSNNTIPIPVNIIYMVTK